MRVSLSLQVFSNSAARSLRFYKDYDSRLSTCRATIEFCTIINNMFDALNRTSIETAVQLSSNDIQVLRDSLNWLNQWEENVQNGLIKKENFITTDAVKVYG
ncbi:uncharacterized protein LOC127288902 [Leptopilina boulardi]|uniref:uncharacterized protein LOC127288902 n=1 Tax=Leptopilina boulardi TaxID=63433 RepID=UPI0021F6832F|nr:uncharacterized protein LOC127288902 [Leptopilina boulardi]